MEFKDAEILVVKEGVLAEVVVEVVEVVELV